MTPDSEVDPVPLAVRCRISLVFAIELLQIIFLFPIWLYGYAIEHIESEARPRVSGYLFPRRCSAPPHFGLLVGIFGAGMRIYGTASSGPTSRALVMDTRGQVEGFVVYRGSIKRTSTTIWYFYKLYHVVQTDIPDSYVAVSRRKAAKFGLD